MIIDPTYQGLFVFLVSRVLTLHVGCRMLNEEIHLAFCLFYPNLKLMIGCNVFLKLKLVRKGGAIMVALLATTLVVYITFNVELTLSHQIMLLR